jgi:hypothetical protein
MMMMMMMMVMMYQFCKKLTDAGVFQNFFSFLTERQVSLKVDNLLEVCMVSTHNIKLQSINPEPVKSSSQ